MNEDDLHRLIARWEALADEAREQTKIVSASDLSRASFNQGVVNTYRSAAQDLRDLLASDAEPIDDDDHSRVYLAVPEAEAKAALERAELFARTLTLHTDNVFTAVFSRLQPITLERRIEQLTAAQVRAQMNAADPRLVIVDSGTLIDTGDPYIDFAFVK